MNILHPLDNFKKNFFFWKWKKYANMQISCSHTSGLKIITCTFRHIIFTKWICCVFYIHTTSAIFMVFFPYFPYKQNEFWRNKQIYTFSELKLKKEKCCTFAFIVPKLYSFLVFFFFAVHFAYFRIIFRQYNDVADTWQWLFKFWWET